MSYAMSYTTPHGTVTKQQHAPVTITRVAVVNRGEPAVRFIRALHDYNAERGTNITSVALATEPDLDAPFTRLADDVLQIGPALQAGPEGGLISAYLRHEELIDALVEAGCDAVWPGWGFIAEDASFVSRLEARGIVFIGPSAEAMRRLGDKITSKHLAERCGVPMADWWEVTLDASDEDVLAHAEAIGYPLMVKASAGGGGRGIRKVNEASALIDAIHAARSEVAKVFGAGGLFIEACVTGARHVEVQLMAGADGKAFALGVRDCSIQRRNQKILEEAPSSVLPEATVDLLCDASVRLAEMAGYRSAGTAEFLYDVARDKAFFLEVNSRLQVEHTVTECITGVDLVHAQIDVARGLPLALSGVDQGHGRAPKSRGWSIEARLCAEDAARGFAPSPGLLRVFRAPTGPGIRVDSGVVEGNEIAAEFDSMIAKVIATGANREQAIARLSRALREMEVVVEDGATNKALLLELLDREEVRDGSADTGWLDRELAAGTVAKQRRAFEAIAFAAIVEYRRQRLADVHAFLAAAQDGIPQNPPKPEALEIELAIGDRKTSVLVHDLGNDRFLVGPADRLHVVGAWFDGDNAGRLEIRGEKFDVRFAYGRKGIAVDVDGAMHTVEPASGGALKAPAPAMVVHVAVEEGQRVEAGDRLVTLEAMKLEMPLYASEAGNVRAVLCIANQQVSAGQVLIVLEEDGAESSNIAVDVWETPKKTPLERLFVTGGPDFVGLDALDDDKAGEAIGDLVAAMRSVLLGHDVSDRFAAGIAQLLGDGLDFSKVGRPERWLPVIDLLRCFGDVEALFDRTLPVTVGGAPTSPHSLFYDVCRAHTEGDKAVPPAIETQLSKALSWYGVHSFDAGPQGANQAKHWQDLRDALWRLHVAHTHSTLRHQLCSLLLRTAIRLHEVGVDVAAMPGLRHELDRITRCANPRHRYVADNARQCEYVLYGQPRFMRRQLEVQAALRADLAIIAGAPESEAGREVIQRLVAAPDSLVPLLVIGADNKLATGAAALEVVVRRTFNNSSCALAGVFRHEGAVLARFLIDDADSTRRIAAVLCNEGDVNRALSQAATAIEAAGWQEREFEVIVPGRHGDAVCETVEGGVPACLGAISAERITVTWHNGNGLRLRTFTATDDDPTTDDIGVAPTELAEDVLLRDIHPEYARRFELARLSAFQLTRIDTPEPVHAFRGQARDNPRDERILVYTGVRAIPDITEIDLDRDPDALWELERAYFEGLRVLREVQVGRSRRDRFHWNRLTIYVRHPVRMDNAAIARIAGRLEGPTRGLGLEKVIVRCRVVEPGSNGRPIDRAIVIARPGKHRLQVTVHEPTERSVRAMSDYAIKVVRARRLGLVYPYELARILTGQRSPDSPAPHPDLAHGQFVEHDLDHTGDTLIPVDRPYGGNTAAVVVGVMENVTAKHPEGMQRVFIAADPTKAMCALAEPECRRIIAAIDLATRMDVPIEWVSISAGAKIAMDSGTENLDWTARVLKSLVEFTQAGGAVHVIVCGVNVGAQSYWNAEATMLMHTRGLLIMTADGSMVLTGKKALEYSGSVAAEDERGIGGFERVMGPNGQAQHFARDLGEAYAVLMEHYRFSYRRRGENAPRRLPTADPASRNVMLSPYAVNGCPATNNDDGFATVGEIFDDAANPGRKRPFDVRAVMGAVIDQDGGCLERFAGMPEGETAVIWDAHLGGYPVCMIGFQSKPQPRRGRIPTDGPDTWTGGTLFPRSSKKVARAINAASGNRPVVVLANLSGFDGSPESLRALQLEYGAEIGRAVVNFNGPIVFVVVGRYHGGAYVVFSKALNSGLTALALTGTYASVIGGAPAAAVVFPRVVRRRAEADPRIKQARAAVSSAAPADKPRAREALQGLLAEVTLEKQGDVAREFDAIHTVQRAVEVGSLDAVISPESLRPEIIERLGQWWHETTNRATRRSSTPAMA